MSKDELHTRAYVKQVTNAYKKFMGIRSFPNFDLVVTQSLERSGGYTTLATHHYDRESGKHCLAVGKDIHKNGAHILFHEFTHIYDIVRYPAVEHNAYAKYKGFTEYHASQVELLSMLGAKTARDEISFSLLDHIQTIFGKTTVLDYVRFSRRSITDIVSQKDFPAKIQTLFAVIGIMFNRLGQISICRQYAIDYEEYRNELENFTLEKQLLGENFEAIVDLAAIQLTTSDVTKMGDLFYGILVHLNEKYKGRD